MREKEPGRSSSKNRGVKRKVATVALAGALIMPMSSSANETKFQDEQSFTTEYSKKTTTNQQSEITWDDIVNGLEYAEDKKISQDEIQEFIENHEEEIMKEFDKMITDNKIKEAIYKELINNEKIKGIVQEMVSDKDVREAALNGDEKYVKEKLNHMLNNDFYERPANILVKGIEVFFSVYILAIIFIVFRRK